MRIGPYRVEAVLHRGECEVLLARAPEGDPLVVKTLSPAAAEREDLRVRLRQEGEILTRLGGRNHVLRCLGALDEPPALLLEHAPGGPLSHRLSVPLPASVALPLFGQLLDAVAHAHAHGFIHRDLKPSNVLLAADGSLRLGDFGVAARRGSRGPLSPSWEEERVGTLAYAAPEQLLDPAAGAWEAADVYALGVVLYEMLTARLPFELLPGEDEASLRERILAGGAVPPSRRVAGVRPALEAAVLTALRRDARERYADVPALGRALGLAG